MTFVRSKLKTPQTARALRHPAVLARALDKSVANAITLELDHGPERAVGLYQGFLRLHCVDVERVSNINLRLDSLSPNFRSIWWSSRSEGKKMPLVLLPISQKMETRSEVQKGCMAIIN